VIKKIGKIREVNTLKQQ